MLPNVQVSHSHSRPGNAWWDFLSKPPPSSRTLQELLGCPLTLQDTLESGQFLTTVILAELNSLHVFFFSKPYFASLSSNDLDKGQVCYAS